MRRILIVDDEPLIAMMMEDWLSELGFEPIGPVGSVASALQATTEHSIDGAILDVSLGAGGDGYEVARILRQRNIPFAFATGGEAEDMDSQFRNVAVLTKPFDFESVKAVLQSLFP